MLKKMMILMCGLCLLISACSKSSKYSDILEVNEEHLTAMEKYVNEIEKAVNAGDVAKVVEQYADSMEKIIPKMKEMAQKYPELKNETEMPEEFKEFKIRMEALGERFSKSTMNIMKYMQDVKVQESFKKMTTVMMKMGEE